MNTLDVDYISLKSFHKKINALRLIGYETSSYIVHFVEINAAELAKGV